MCIYIENSSIAKLFVDIESIGIERYIVHTNYRCKNILY